MVNFKLLKSQIRKQGIKTYALHSESDFGLIIAPNRSLTKFKAIITFLINSDKELNTIYTK